MDNKHIEWGEYERDPLITTGEYNIMVNNIKSRKKEKWLKPFIELCRKYMDSENFTNGGPLHIILEDGNIDDVNLYWCAGYAFGKCDFAGNQISGLMMFMTIKQRNIVIKNYEEYSF